MDTRKIISFGFGPRNAEGSDFEPVEWIVLDEREGMLLISKDIITSYCYQKGSIKEENGVSWKDCSLRRSLNGDFMNRFIMDRGQLLPPGIGEIPGDCVSILSYEEIKKYMPTEKERACGATEYARAASDIHDCWMMRMDRAADWHCWSVNPDGSFETDYGYPSDVCGVRPVIRIKKKK